MADDIYIFGTVGDMALLGGMLRGQGISAQEIRPFSRFEPAGIIVPGSHAHLARQIIKEYDGKQIKVLTAQEYRRNRRLIIVILATALAAAALLLWAMKHEHL